MDLSKDLARRGSTVGFHLLWHTVELAMSTRLCLLLWLIWFLCFRFDTLTELGAFMRTEFLCVSVLRAASGPRVKLAICKSTLKPPVVCSTDYSKAVVLVLVLLFVSLWFILRGDLLYVVPCVILFLCFFSPFSIAITSLGEERANLSAFRTFVRFVLVWLCRFLLPLGVWEELRFVIVALRGLSSYLFVMLKNLLGINGLNWY